MATIDKFYGSGEERRLLKRWLVRHKKRAWFRYFYGDWKRGAAGQHSIACFPSEVDRWLWVHCDLQWVRDRIYVWNYDGKQPPLRRGEK